MGNQKSLLNDCSSDVWTSTVANVLYTYNI